MGDFRVRLCVDGIGRFLSIDPLWEKYLAWSPYHYCRNNPINRVDPNGFRDDAYSFGIGMYLANANDKDQSEFIESIGRCNQKILGIEVGIASMALGVGGLVGSSATIGSAVLSVFTIPTGAYELSVNTSSLFDRNVDKYFPSTLTGYVIKHELNGDEKAQKQGATVQNTVFTTLDAFISKNIPSLILNMVNIGLSNIDLQTSSDKDSKKKAKENNSKPIIKTEFDDHKNQY